MKLKIILSLLVMVMSISASYASFPVTRTATNTTANIANSIEEETTMLVSPAAAPAAAKKMSTALLLWFFLGGLAIHRFYLGSPIGWNILFILTLGGLGIWWIVDGVDIITENYPGL